MVPRDRHHAVTCAQPGERREQAVDDLLRTVDDIAGQRDQIGLERVDLADDLGDVRGADRVAGVQVADLDDTHSIEASGRPGQVDEGVRHYRPPRLRRPGYDVRAGDGDHRRVAGAAEEQAPTARLRRVVDPAHRALEQYRDLTDGDEHEQARREREHREADDSDRPVERRAAIGEEADDRQQRRYSRAEIHDRPAATCRPRPADLPAEENVQDEPADGEHLDLVHEDRAHQELRARLHRAPAVDAPTISPSAPLLPSLQAMRPAKIHGLQLHRYMPSYTPAGLVPGGGDGISTNPGALPACWRCPRRSRQ